MFGGCRRARAVALADKFAVPQQAGQLVRPSFAPSEPGLAPRRAREPEAAMAPVDLVRMPDRHDQESGLRSDGRRDQTIDGAGRRRGTQSLLPVPAALDPILGRSGQGAGRPRAGRSVPAPDVPGARLRLREIARAVPFGVRAIRVAAVRRVDRSAQGSGFRAGGPAARLAPPRVPLHEGRVSPEPPALTADPANEGAH
ncbi:MAG TPA: hypothetical protein VKA15_14945, partial [Isosphaeraceae bacterium]|nr:hypothetical protein [Isosphaeraceae bacterium]